MWVLLRLLVALGVGIYRFSGGGALKGKARESTGFQWVLHQGRHKGRVVSNAMGVPFRNSVYFKLSKESGMDRFFKAVGFSREMQSGDAAFDSTVYVSCDHPAIEPLLQESAELRAAILALFAAGFSRIRTDGEYLCAYRSGSPEPNDTDVANLMIVRDALDAIPVPQMRMLQDPYFWRAALVESLAWSIAFYATPTLFELIARSHPQYFYVGPVIKYGVLAGLVIFVGLFLLSRLLLSGSSRSHRVLTESTLLLLFGVPLSSIQLVSDANITFDHSPATPVQQTVNDKYTRITRSKRRTQTHYHLRLAPAGPESPPMPHDVEVAPGIYHSVGKGGTIVSEMRAGALGIPWVESMHAKR